MKTPADNVLDFDLKVEDRQWLADFWRMTRSQSNFILAELTEGADVAGAAARVLAWRSEGFRSTLELMNECVSHRWHPVYEAWIANVASEIDDLSRALDPLTCRALRTCQKHSEFADVDPHSWWDAVADARAALEGTDSPVDDPSGFLDYTEEDPTPVWDTPSGHLAL